MLRVVFSDLCHNFVNHFERKRLGDKAIHPASEGHLNVSRRCIGRYAHNVLKELNAAESVKDAVTPQTASRTIHTG